jgi:drug/metabolite transporter (DMT)-like permease
MTNKGSAIQQRSEAIGLALGAIGVLVFSMSFPATRASVPVFGGWVVGIGRAVVAAALAGVVLTVTGAPKPPPDLQRRLLLVAGGVVLGFPLLSALALEYVPASRGAIVVGGLPVATAAVAAIRHGERPSTRFWLAAAAGAITVVAFATATGSGGRPEPADGLLLLAVVAAAVGYAEGGSLSQEIGGWQTISWALVYATPVTVPFTVGAMLLTDIGTVTTTSVLGLAYVSVFSMFLGFFAWYAGLSLGGTARVSQIQLLQPILTLVWASILLGETITVGAVAAAVGVVASVLAARRAPIGFASERQPGSEASPAPLAALPVGQRAPQEGLDGGEGR